MGGVVAAVFLIVPSLVSAPDDGAQLQKAMISVASDSLLSLFDEMVSAF